MIDDAIDEIRDALPKMTPQQRKVGQFICENPDTLGVLSLTDFATRVGISGPTVTRFCRALGYTGFVEFSRRMQSLKHNEISHASYFHNARIRNERGSQPGGLARVLLEKDIANVRKLLESYPDEKITRCVALMRESSAMAIIGRMSALPPAVYFEQLLSKVTPKLLPMHGADVLQAAVLSRLDKKSLVFCLAFPRYPKIALELARAAADRGATIIAITNRGFSPLAEISRILFSLDVEIFSYIDLFGPVFALINVICMEFSLAQSDLSEKSLAKYDGVVADVFFKTGRKPGRKKI